MKIPFRIIYQDRLFLNVRNLEEFLRPGSKPVYSFD